MNALTLILQFFNTEKLIAISSFFVAGASFWISWLTYKRDSGRLDFYVGLGEIWDGRPLEKISECIQFRIVNSGRRPLIASSIGGDLKGDKKNCFLSNFFPKHFRSRAFIIDSPEISESLRPNGKFRVLNEGDFISFFLPLPKYDALFEEMALKSGSIYVFDTVSRKHRVPNGVLKKLAKDFNERKSKINNAQ